MSKVVPPLNRLAKQAIISLCDSFLETNYCRAIFQLFNEKTVLKGRRKYLMTLLIIFERYKKHDNYSNCIIFTFLYIVCIINLLLFIFQDKIFQFIT